MFKNNPNTLSGIILLNKKENITSFDALTEIKKKLESGKVGHTGTLDKFAAGLLIVLTGKALKLSPLFFACDKLYEADVFFGIETDTLDPEGSSIAVSQLPCLNDIEKTLSGFTGTIMQAPPEYCAIHINGKRASAMARSGELPRMQERPVIVYRLELMSWEPPIAKLLIHCSSGTYIRSLARDIALSVNCRAHVSALKRKEVAGFKLEENKDFLLPIKSSQLIICM
jgi:tRNA pseudouridine55 synthase